MRSVGALLSLFLGPAVWLWAGSTGLRAQEMEPGVAKGVAFLKREGVSKTLGEAALTALALAKAGVAPDDPALTACLTRLHERFQGGSYKPELKGGPEVYEAAVVALALANHDAGAGSWSADLQSIARFLAGRQKENGSWDYANRPNTNTGDSSMAQYALLGLWEAESSGARVSPDVWDRAARWFISVQGPEGGWKYHPDGDPNTTETISMTAAGIGSLLICQRQLAPYRRGAGAASKLLTPLVPEGQRPRYDVEASSARIDNAVSRGMKWLAANFAIQQGPTMGLSVYYGLYGIERVGTLAQVERLGRSNWFEEGRQFILGTQAADGSWNGFAAQVSNTTWAVLFLTRSTAKTMKRIEVKRLGAGTLLGGRGLPQDLSSMTVAGGKVVSRPLNGAVEQMLAVLEDPRAAHADSAVQGLVDRYYARGPEALRPHKDRLRKMAHDRDPGVRRVAAWTLARTGDLDVAPALIEALTDPDEAVVTLARQGLQLLSRKIDGLGPPSPSTPAQRQEAARRWRDWYNAIRPLDLEGHDVEVGATAAPAAGSQP